MLDCMCGRSCDRGEDHLPAGPGSWRSSSVHQTTRCLGRPGPRRTDHEKGLITSGWRYARGMQKGPGVVRGLLISVEATLDEAALGRPIAYQLTPRAL